MRAITTATYNLEPDIKSTLAGGLRDIHAWAGLHAATSVRLLYPKWASTASSPMPSIVSS